MVEATERTVDIRLMCLELAQKDGTTGELAVQRAKIYYEWVRNGRV